jgi:hypothetical protein
MQSNIRTCPAGSVIGWDNEVRLHRIGDHLHGLGPRAVGEALIGEASASGDPEATLRRLEPYTRLPRQKVVAAGADRPLRPRLVVAP